MREKVAKFFLCAILVCDVSRHIVYHNRKFEDWDMKTEEKLNMTMLCDFYELTMGNGYFKNGYKDRITYFDVFFRRVPDGGGFAIAAGLEQLIDYIENLHFTDEDIAYLRGRNLFDEEFLAYLKDFKFTGDIYAVPEGTPMCTVDLEIPNF